MAQISANAERLDPYKNFKFRVKLDGRYVAGVSKVGALKCSTELPGDRRAEIHSPPELPGRSRFEAITLERGVTHDLQFERWASKVWNYGSELGVETSLKAFRKNITLEVYNYSGQLAIAHRIYRCRVSEFQAMPDLNANANGLVIQSMKLENEGCERDYDVTEPSEQRPPDRE